MKSNTCNNCKLIKYQLYGKNLCKAAPSFNKETATFSLRTVSSIRAKRDACPYYKPNLCKKFKSFLTLIRIAYYKRRYPELFI